MTGLSLLEAVSICQGTDWKFRRRAWSQEKYAQVSRFSGAITFFDGRNHGKHPKFGAESILALDYEVVRG